MPGLHGAGIKKILFSNCVHWWHFSASLMLMSECVSVCVHECMCVCVIIEILALGKITKVTRFNLPSSLAFNSIITIWKHLPSNSLRGKWGKNVIWFILWSQKKWWTREMVWSIKCWSHKCENQSLIPRIHLKKKNGSCVLVISAGKLKTGEPWGLARQPV